MSVELELSEIDICSLSPTEIVLLPVIAFMNMTKGHNDTEVSPQESTSPMSVPTRNSDNFSSTNLVPFVEQDRQFLFHKLRVILLVVCIIILFLLTFLRKTRFLDSFNTFLSGIQSFCSSKKTNELESTIEVQYYPWNDTALPTLEQHSESNIDECEEALEVNNQKSAEYWKNLQIQREQEKESRLRELEKKKQELKEKRRKLKEDLESQREAAKKQTISTIIAKLEEPIILESRRLDDWLRKPD